ncbi:hypothetical protein [Psychrobium sp. 1_MG-2023]|uniref:hypothetical protein n=1 Tax=Psychrobium sp. 1_MG-2023 TaxID=3062624 RepID=UPI00129250A3|nr:hypothetical protein [Psychrobium sp. 1_MG-2023]MDP2562191.1 hypothetical protein [Psychrobium sp. 1_MG-2023]
MQIRNQFQNYQTTPTASENLAANAAAPNSIKQNLVVDGVEAAAENGQARVLQVGDEDQQQQEQARSLTQAQYESVAAAHQESQTIYDQPQVENRLAISSYQAVANAPRREEIQRLVGIDIFA